MAVEHHLGERSHTIEQCHNLLSGKRVERKDFVNLEEGGSEWVWNQGGDLSVETVNGDHREWGGCLCQKTVSMHLHYYSQVLFQQLKGTLEWKRPSMWSVLLPQPCSVLFCSSVESVSGEQQTESGWHFHETRAV